METNAKFKITGWDEVPFDESEDGSKLTRAHITRSFHGDLTGAGNLMYVMSHLSSGVASFTGYEKVEGSLHGRTGGFVLSHTGSFDGGMATADYEVVPGSGTGELAGLSGSGSYSAGSTEEHDMTLEYDL